MVQSKREPGTNMLNLTLGRCSHLYARQVRPQSSDSLSGDELTVVEFYSLEVVAAHQVVQAGVGHQGAVVQLQHCQVLTGAGGHPKMP